MTRSAGQKAGLTVADVVDAAVEVVDRDGLEALTMAAVAQALDVRSPSLYAHVGGLADLRRQVALRAAGRMADALRSSGGEDGGVDALRRIIHAYRAFAARHPGLYEAAQSAVRPEDDEELYAALAAAAAPAVAAVAGAGVREEDRVHVVRALRAALHGFVDLERRGGFGMPDPLEESYRRLADLMVHGVVAAARP